MSRVLTTTVDGVWTEHASGIEELVDGTFGVNRGVCSCGWIGVRWAGRASRADAAADVGRHIERMMGAER